MNTILRTICLAFCLILSVSVITSCKKGTHPPATKPEAQGIGTGGQASTEMEGLSENDLLDNAGKDDFSLMGNQDDEYKKMYGRSTKPLLPIYFDFDQFTISAEQGERLQKNARYMLDHPEVKVVVEGNCDERGDERVQPRPGRKTGTERQGVSRAAGRRCISPEDRELRRGTAALPHQG